MADAAGSDRPVVEVRKNDRGAWCVWLDGCMVSDHRSHEAARIAAGRHLGLDMQAAR